MNRYTAAGLHAAALDGDTITVVAIDLDSADHHFEQYLEHVGHEDTTHVCLVNGKKHVRYPSGSTIHFTSYGSAHRGTTTPTALCYDWRNWYDQTPASRRADFTAWPTELIPADD